MKLIYLLLALFFCICSLGASFAQAFETDTINSSDGAIKFTFIGHGTLLVEFADKVIHIDPWSKLADYKTLPKADLILITHEHGDHLDAKAIADLKTEKTKVVCPEACSQSLPDARIIKNNESLEAFGIKIEALPAYNIAHKRDTGEPFHPLGRGNAYLLTLGDKRVLIGGDTENTPELKALQDIAVAFLPMNLPYTMTPEMLSDLALAIKPKILYPYHFGETDTGKLVELLKENKEIEVRIRKMK